jgi:hypothetical protein
MPAIHLKAHGVDRPQCRWKEATRSYILTENHDEVTCRKCMGTIGYHPGGTVKVQKKASLHEETVKKVARDNITKPRRVRGKAKRPNTSKVVRKHWSDNMHPMIVAYVKKHKISHTRIDVRGPEEIVIH